LQKKSLTELEGLESQAESLDPKSSCSQVGYRRRNLFVPVVLLFCYVLQCAWFARTQSITFDESIHTSVGLDIWRHHRFDRWIETPPLGRLLLALPIVGERFQMEVRDPDGWIYVTAFHPNARSFIAGPRAVNVGLGVTLGILLWIAIRGLFSEGAANFALVLFAFSPQFISHFTVATVDGIAVLTVFAVAFELVRWRRNPSQRQTLLMGMVCGLALLAKFYAPAFVGLALVLMLLTPRRRDAEEQTREFTLSPRAWSWQPVLVTVSVAVLLVWAGYFFSVGHLAQRNGQLTLTYPHGVAAIKTSGLKLNLDAPLPAAEFFAGLHELALHNRLGHPSFLLGRVYRTAAPHSFFPVVIALKWPTITLLLATAGIILLIRNKPNLGRRARIEVAIFAAYGLLALLLALSANLGIGDRHVLTLYPFLLVFASTVWYWASGLVTRKRVAMAALVFLAALNAADVLRYAPAYLSYFNVFIPPARTYALVTDSNLDWGQGLLALRAYQQQHSNEPIHLAYFGSVDPQVYDIRWLPLLPGQRVSGTVVVSATLLSGQYLRDPGAYRWLLQYPPKAFLDHCMLVFETPQE